MNDTKINYTHPTFPEVEVAESSAKPVHMTSTAAYIETKQRLGWVGFQRDPSIAIAEMIFWIVLTAMLVRMFGISARWW